MNVNERWTDFTRLLLLPILGGGLLAADPPCNAQTAGATCPGAPQPKQVAELLFGRDIGRRGGVSAAAWARFVARELTPRFPDGLTVTDATGQWRIPRTATSCVSRPSGSTSCCPAPADDQERLDAVVTAYKRKFHQHSVGVIVRTACVSF